MSFVLLRNTSNRCTQDISHIFLSSSNYYRNHNNSTERKPFNKNNSIENTTKRSNGNKKWSPHKRVRQIDLGNGITNVQLSRAEKLNSLDLPMFEDIVSVAHELKNDTSTRVIILSGEGRVFSTGLDLPSLLTKGNPFTNISKLLQRKSYNPSKKSGDNEEAICNLAQDVGYIWRTIPVPVIAVLHGMCFGGGMQIALGADLRFATPTCQISLMESKFGLIPDMAASITLRELIRIDVAKELTMTGKIISGTDAASLGLITRVADDPMKEAMSVAKEIVEKSPDSVAACKRLFQNTWCLNDERECLKMETGIQKDLLGSWNQIAATSKSFGVTLPFKRRKDVKDESKEVQ